MIILIKRIHILQISLKTLLLFCIISSCSSEKQSITVNNELIHAPVKYAINKLSSLENVDGNWKISTQLDTLLGAEAFEVAANGKVVKVTGGDAVGVMYGLLYIKEQLEQGKSDIPKTIDLHGNYPNPFNPQTSITFSLPEANRVTIAIYSVNGTLIRQFTAGHLSAGYHEVTWNGRNQAGKEVSSGEYIYQVVTPDHVASGKMLFMK